MKRPFAGIAATAAERTADMPGDQVITPAEVIMDRGFTVPGTVEQVWPWIAQLGKGRGRWYLTRSLERFLPTRGRGLRHIEPRWQQLEVGTVIPDYGKDETFTVEQIRAPHELVYFSQRGRTAVTWAITLTETDPIPGTLHATRVRLRLRFGGIRRTWLVESGGELIDLLTIAGMAAGLRERLTDALAAVREAEWSYRSCITATGLPLRPRATRSGSGA